MKILILSFACFLLTNKSIAQYQSLFGQSSTEWVFEWVNLDFGGQDTIFVEKDTIAFGHSWKKIMMKLNTNQFAGGLVREDTTTGKVWTKGLYFQQSSMDTVEMLAFDYSLNIGDTFNITNGYEGFNPLFRTVDSIYYISGNKYIQFDYFLYSGFPFLEKYTIVEGVSGIMSVVWKFSGLGGLMAPYLLCTYKDGIKTTFENKRYNGNCNIYWPDLINENNNFSNTIMVHPNPASNILIINYDNNLARLTKVTIYDIQGNVMKQQINSSTIDVSDLSIGSYIIQLTFNNQFTTHKLFQKQ